MAGSSSKRFGRFLLVSVLYIKGCDNQLAGRGVYQFQPNVPFQFVSFLGGHEHIKRGVFVKWNIVAERLFDGDVSIKVQT